MDRVFRVIITRSANLPTKRKYMAIADLKNVLKIFRGAEVSEDKQNELYKEVLLMTLARAADADINIQNIEVERIQKILKEHTGETFSSADIRADSYLMELVETRSRMLGAANDAEYIAAFGQLSLLDQGLLDQPCAPLLLVNGKEDRQCPIEDVHLLIEYLHRG